MFEGGELGLRYEGPGLWEGRNFRTLGKTRGWT